MLLSVRENSLPVITPEIEETEEEKLLSAQELKKIYFKWALNNIRGKRFFNKSIMRNISIARDGLGEWKSATKSREQALSIKILDDLLKIAVYWKEKPHKPPDPNIEKVIYFKQRCRVNGKDYTAVITVKVYKSEGLYKYYHHYLDDIIIEPEK